MKTDHDGHDDAVELIELATEGRIAEFGDAVSALFAAGQLASVGRELSEAGASLLPVQVLLADLRSRTKTIELYDLAELERRIRQSHPDSDLLRWMAAIMAEWGLWQGDMSTVGYGYGTVVDGGPAMSRLAIISEARRERIEALVSLATGADTVRAMTLADAVRTKLRDVSCHEELAVTDVVLGYAQLAITDDQSLEPMAVLERGVKELDRLGADRLPFALACYAWSSYMVGDFASAAEALERYDEIVDPGTRVPPLVREGVEMLRGLSNLVIDGASPEAIDRIRVYFERLRRHTMPAWFVGPLANDLLDVGEIDLAAEIVSSVGPAVSFVKPAHQSIREVEARVQLLRRADRTAIDSLWSLYGEWEAGGRSRRAAASAVRCSWSARLAGLEAEADRLYAWGIERLPDPSEYTVWERTYVEGLRPSGDAGRLVRGELRALAPDLVVVRDGETVLLGDVQAKLLALLAAVRRPVTTDWIINALWADVDPDTGRNRLGAALHRLRQRLGLLPDELVRRSRHGIELDGHGWDVDVWRFWDLSAGDAESRLRALDLYRSDLVARQLAYDDALEEERGELRRRWWDTTRSLVDTGHLTEEAAAERARRVGIDELTAT
ncbi:MAG TPA: hypothetical protein VJM33_04690 [Microthrixaceae bacterium]|nr:hypothetical protein [Microthrixaceae bacterium]